MTAMPAARARRLALAALMIALAAPAGPGAAQAAFISGVGAFQAPVTSLRDMPFRTVVRQQFDYSCGSAALATLLRYHYGRPVTEADVFRAMYAKGDQAKIRKVGFSLLDMKVYLASAGIAADGYRLEAASLGRMAEPGIALVRVGNYRHFVVVKGVRDGKVLVGDPALGLKAYGLAEFAGVWDGVVLKVHAASAAGTFDRPEEWSSLRPGPLAPLDAVGLAAVTRELPPLYQITEVRP